MLIVFLFITIILSPIVLGNPESTFDVTEYADNDSRFIQTVIIGQSTFTEQGEPGYYVIEGENLATYETIVEIDNMENAIAEANVSARWLGSLPYIVRTQVILATSTENYTSFVPKTVNPLTGFPTSSEEIYKVLEDVYRNGTVNLGGTYRVSPSEARGIYFLEDGKITMVRSWFLVLRPDDIYGQMKEQKKDLDAASTDLNSMEGVSVQVAGLSYERYVYVLEITDSFQQSLGIAIVLAFLIVLFVLRDLRLSLITILPVVAITLWLRGGMVLTGTSINLVTVQISSLAIGLGVDYAIHMVQRVREARFDNPDGTKEEWMAESLDETGNNVAMSAFTDFVGFMVLTLSIMPLFVTFGMIMAIMIFLSFVAAVIMLPALLYRFGNLEGQRPPLEPSVDSKPEEPIFDRKPRLVKKVKKSRLPNPT
jgi:predicted RND superfamily exporter protein